MNEDFHEKAKIKAEGLTGGKNNPLLKMLESMDATNESEVLFRLDKLLGGRLAEIAKDKEVLAQKLSATVIPMEVWRSTTFLLDGENYNTPDGIKYLADWIYSEVLIHKILDLPISHDWNPVATNKIGFTLDAEKDTIAKFWVGVKKYKVPVNDAIAALAHVGIDPGTSGVFDIEEGNK